MKKRKIFLGPCEIAGYYANLAAGLQQAGEHCDYVTYSPHPFGYGGETYSPRLLRWAKFFESFRGRQKKFFIVRALLVSFGIVLAVTWKLWAILKYDVFIFGFGETLMEGNRDLRVIKFFGKKIISNLSHGSEARLSFIDGAYQSKDGCTWLSPEQLIFLQKDKAERFRKIELYSDFIIGAGASTSHFATKKFINTLAIGIPFDSEEQEKIADNLSKPFNGLDGVVRILHSPSHPAAKGSRKIELAIQSLKDKGYQIELVLLQGRSFSEVIEEIKKTDFVVDQLYSDGPLAGFATEAAWFGKPAVVAGYSLEYLKTLAPEGMCPISKTCLPDDIERAIEDLILNTTERLELGYDTQHFVHEKWNSTAVANRYQRLINNDVPDDWWLDPSSIFCLEGAGQSLERTKDNIRQMVQSFGVASLQLSHRPDLERAFLELANIEATIQ